MAVNLDPVGLSGWPKCTDNMTWSEDHLAVASGEVIHVLTPRDQIKSPDSHLNYWHVEPIRVSHFSEKEWPIVELASLSELSLGEEQSSVSVCSLSWSPVGIGPHKRSVLAVLTTNLQLSLWESSGVPGSWQRTCVVNNLFATEESLSDCRKQRVRAFAWLPAVRINTESRRAQQYLVIVDDEDNISVLHLAKGISNTITDWQLKLVYNCQLTREKASATKGKSNLQCTLLTSPITQIQAGQWQTLDGGGSSGALRIVISFTRGVAGSACPHLVLSCEHRREEWAFQGYTRDCYSPPDGLLPPPPSEAIAAALAKPKQEFDKQFNLQGHVRVKHWGTAKASDCRITAACVTFHPSDMMEHSIPSSERCTIVFAPLLATEEDILTYAPEGDPRREVLRWLAANTSIDNMTTDMDLKLVRVAAACVYTTFSDDASLMEWSRAAAVLADNSQIANDAGAGGDAPMQGSSRFVRATINEPCEMCTAAISISQDLRSGRCSQGHTFARCGISSLAIQEPGISKYCSRCGKEFLDLAKLEPHEGPSLSKALFEEFDVCPYCRGKFRG